MLSMPFLTVRKLVGKTIVSLVNHLLDEIYFVRLQLPSYIIIRHSLIVGPHFWCSGKIIRHSTESNIFVFL